MDTGGTPTGSQDSGRQASAMFASPQATANRFQTSTAPAAGLQYGTPQQPIHGAAPNPTYGGQSAFGSHLTPAPPTPAPVAYTAGAAGAAAGFQHHSVYGTPQQQSHGPAPTYGVGGGGFAYPSQAPMATAAVAAAPGSAAGSLLSSVRGTPQQHFGGGLLFGSPPPPSPVVSIPGSNGMTALGFQQQHSMDLQQQPSAPLLASTTMTAAKSAMGLLYLDQLMDDNERAGMLTELVSAHGPTSEIGKKIRSGDEVLKKLIEDEKKGLTRCEDELEALKLNYEFVVRQCNEQKQRIEESLKFLESKAELHGPLMFCTEAHLHPITHRHATPESLWWMMKHAKAGERSVPDLASNDPNDSYDVLCSRARKIFGVRSADDVWTIQNMKVLIEVLFIIKDKGWHTNNGFKSHIEALKFKNCLPRNFQSGRIYASESDPIDKLRCLVAMYLKVNKYSDKLVAFKNFF